MTRVARPGARAARPAVVTFDCWNTLLQEKDWETAHALRVEALVKAVAEVERQVTWEAAEGVFNAAWTRHMQDWNEGVASGAHDVARWALEGFVARPPDHVVDRLVEVYEEASHSSRVVALDGARDTLAALQAAGIHCALVCDTGLTPGRVVRRHLDRVGVLALLDVQVFSDEVGVPKPHARPFEAALAPFGFAPERALHVGDLRRTDVAGARGMGMTSVRIREPHDDAGEQPEADFVVSRLIELIDLIGLG